MTIVELNDLEWRILVALKREFEPEELAPNLWAGARRGGAGAARNVSARSPRTSTAARSSAASPPSSNTSSRSKTGERVTHFNALFHWAVPPGREIEAGREVGRHHIMTHAYWREGGPEFRNVNVMGVAHGTDKDRRARPQGRHRRAPRTVGIPVSYTNVFWGGRSEIKPSEISPFAYRDWCRQTGSIRIR